MSIKHLVLGSLEGVFALGQVYVLISRVTDPKNLLLLGVPPKDLLEDLAQELLRQGIDVDAFFEAACQVTGEWKYDASKSRLIDRIQQRYCHERCGVPLKSRSLAECLNPQPDAQVGKAVCRMKQDGCTHAFVVNSIKHMTGWIVLQSEMLIHRPSLGRLQTSAGLD